MPASLRFCLIGHPLGHTLSPFLHDRLFALSGLAGRYTAIDLLPERLSVDLPTLLKRIAGCNVTIPHKQAVLPFCDRLEGKAARYQTVNCIAVRPDAVIGFNTDADGFLSALSGAGLRLQGVVAVIGAGGAGTVFACEAAAAGAEVLLVSRRRERADALRDRVLRTIPGAACRVLDRAEDFPAVDLLLNASPVGMFPNVDASPVPAALLSRVGGVFDAVYNPQETRLLREARAAGIPALGGMTMLVRQAALSHTIWYGASFSDEALDALAQTADAELTRLRQWRDLF